MKQDFLTKGEKDNVRKAAHRMEAVMKSIADRGAKPPRPESMEEFNAPLYQTWASIVEINRALMTLGFLIGQAEGEDIRSKKT